MSDSIVHPLACGDIDSRSFHVFETNSQKLLFDRATCSTTGLNGTAFELLSLIEQRGSSEGVSRFLEMHSDISESDISDIIQAMKNTGMFRFTATDRSAQDRELENLWLHKPRRLQMLMAQGCNLGCRYCYAWRNGSNQKHTLMPFEISKQAVDYLVWRSGERPEIQITFFGGEPLLNYPVIQQLVQYARAIEAAGKKKFVFELCTNCTLLDREVTDFLVKERFLLFMSIDGWREMHNYNRPSMDKTDAYDLIVGNAKYAHEQYDLNNLPTPRIRANLTNKFHDAKAVATYLEGLGFTNVAIGSIEPLPHGDASPSALSEDQADDLSQQWREMTLESLAKLKAGQVLERYAAQNLVRTAARPEKLSTLGVTCGIGRNTLIVDNKGNLFPCHRYEGMDACRLGNVFTGLDRELTMRYYRQVNGHATDHCDDCWIRDYCGGGCVWLLSTKQGHLADPTERECNRRRRAMETSLAARAEMRKCFPDRFRDDEISLDSWNWSTSTPPASSKGHRRLALNVLPSSGPASGCGN